MYASDNLNDKMSCRLLLRIWVQVYCSYKQAHGGTKGATELAIQDDVDGDDDANVLIDKRAKRTRWALEGPVLRLMVMMMITVLVMMMIVVREFRTRSLSRCFVLIYWHFSSQVGKPHQE